MVPSRSLTRPSITLTLLPFPMSLLKSPSRWTTLINGNVWITIGLFLVRYVLLPPPPFKSFAPHATAPCALAVSLILLSMSWLFGIGRHRSLPAHQSTADRAAPSEKTSSPESVVPSGQRNGPESVAPAENPIASPPTSASSTETTRTTRSTRSTRAAPRRGKKAAAAAELEEIGKDASS